MYRITANTAATPRAQAPPPARPSRSTTCFEPVDARAEEPVPQGAESADTLERIAAALDELPPKLRAVVVLKDVYGLSHEAIAEELGISVTAAKVRLHRGRRKLRDVLYEEGAEGANAV